MPENFFLFGTHFVPQNPVAALHRSTEWKQLEIIKGRLETIAADLRAMNGSRSSSSLPRAPTWQPDKDSGFLPTRVLPNFASLAISESDAQDGNSLFEAIVVLLERRPGDHHRLRQEVCNYMMAEKNKGFFASFVMDAELETHVQMMRQDGVPGEDAELMAVASMSDNVLLVHDETHPDRVEVIYDHRYRKPIHTMHLYYTRAAKFSYLPPSARSPGAIPIYSPVISPSDFTRSSPVAQSHASTLAYQDLLDLGAQPRLMTGDGNCLFRALADQLLDDQELFYIIRAEICDFMEANPHLIEGFLVDEAPVNDLDQHEYVARHPRDVRGYVQHMREDKVWGGDCEVSMAAKLYNVVIEIHRRDGAATTVIRDQRLAERPGQPAQTLHLVYKPAKQNNMGAHYDSLRVGM